MTRASRRRPSAVWLLPALLFASIVCHANTAHAAAPPAWWYEGAEFIERLSPPANCQVYTSGGVRENDPVLCSSGDWPYRGERMDAFCRFREGGAKGGGDDAHCGFHMGNQLPDGSHAMCGRDGLPDFETPERFRDAWTDYHLTAYATLQECIDAVLPCKRGFLTKDWLGYSQGDLLAATTPDASYGLAIRWCTVPGKSTTLDSANVRVEENRGGGNLDAFGRALEALTIEVNQRWVPNKSQKVKTKALPGGGIRVTAATGHFDVCVGLGELIGGVGRRAFKLLPKRAQARLVRSLRESATNAIERGADRRYKAVKEQLVGKKNPKTGRVYTRQARENIAEQVARGHRRLYYWLLDSLLGGILSHADFKQCFRAWTPKITATIAVDGTAVGMFESGSSRGILWRIVEDKAGS